MGLTPVWLDSGRKGALAPAAKFRARLGFEAIRIPLYLIWGQAASAERLASYLDFWNDFGGKPIPAWTDVNDNSLAPYSGSTGFKAIIHPALAFGQPNPLPLPTIGPQYDYYPPSLTLLPAFAHPATAA